MVATPDDWGESKPHLRFFEHVIAAVPYGAEELLSSATGSTTTPVDC